MLLLILKIMMLAILGFTVSFGLGYAAGKLFGCIFGGTTIHRRAEKSNPVDRILRH